MSEITFDVDPLVLRDVPGLLPSSIRITGCLEADGYVRFVASAPHMPSGHYSVRVTDSASRRIVDIWPVSVDPDTAA